MSGLVASVADFADHDGHDVHVERLADAGLDATVRAAAADDDRVTTEHVQELGDAGPVEGAGPAFEMAAEQFRVIAELSDQCGKGFCDLTTRQQVQMRWFTIGDVPEIWRRLEEVGLHSKQTGMDNVRGIVGCPVAGFRAHELLDASRVIHRFNESIVRAGINYRFSL